MSNEYHILFIWVLSTMCLMYFSLGYDPIDNYLIDSGSSSNTSVGNRTFIADVYDTNILSTRYNIFANTSSNVASPFYGSALFRTARILNETTHYTFPIKEKGHHWIRLYFFPFDSKTYNLSAAKFSVSAQNFTLLKDFQAQNVSLVKEYCLNIAADSFVLTFAPSANSFAFVNALEVFSLPDGLIPDSARTGDHQSNYQSLRGDALETVARVNMGDEVVSPQNDTLWRPWVSDITFLKHMNLAIFVSKINAVNYTRKWPTEDIAPRSVYGTATQLNNTQDDNRFNANVTWHFDVDPGFEYLVRFHFCDIVSTNPEQQLLFNVYINSWYVYRDFDLTNVTSHILGAPYFMDVITRVSDSRMLNVSIGPSTVSPYPIAILNGLEIMKINDSMGSLDVSNSESLKSSSKLKLGVIVGASVGGFFAVVLALIFFLLCRRRNKMRHVFHSKAEDHFVINIPESKYCIGTIGYRFPFVAIQEATDNFRESLVIGVGGFGKVYKGVLRDETKVAVKRGASQSRQGLAEFRTEIEMLSQFRHRHLVSFIGYCDERNEMIIIYEYMENGSLKNHLYGENLPTLSWRQRLEICIGSARGLHYLHTGSTKAIIHRDVKTANILLDENFMAKVADFGLSKTGPEIDQTYVSTAVKGSFGYLDPEYLTRQQLTEKSDVYSFGVVMFEILCGRPVIDPSLPAEKVNLIEWAMKWLKKGKLEDIVDPCLAGHIKLDSLSKFGDIAGKCLSGQGVDRPSMGDVLWNLESALQLQGNRERPDHNGFKRLESNASNATQFSTVVSDFAGESMSMVFAQMVSEEMR